MGNSRDNSKDYLLKHATKNNYSNIATGFSDKYAAHQGKNVFGMHTNQMQVGNTLIQKHQALE